MAWDDIKVDGTDQLTAIEWNTHVTDQKGHKARHATGGTDALLGTDLPIHAKAKHDSSVDTLTTQTDQTGSRAIGTVYQNTSGHTIWISAYFNTGSTGLIQAITDSNASPTLQVGSMPISANGTGIVFAVLAGNYYKIINGGTSLTLQKWIEWT